MAFIECNSNPLGKLDVSHNPELVKLSCGYNRGKLKSIDVSHNPKLVFLDCHNNNISSLDISKNPNLYYLMAYTNPLKEIKIGNCPRLLKVYKDGVWADESDHGDVQSWTLDYGGDTSTKDDQKYFLMLNKSTKVNTASLGGSTPERRGQQKVADSTNLITREAAAYYLYCWAGKPAVRGKSRFKDVVPGTWYYDAVVWGEQNDAICVGTPDISDNTFGVGDWITREDLTLMLMRYAEYKGYERAIDFGRTDDYIDYYAID